MKTYHTLITGVLMGIHKFNFLDGKISYPDASYLLAKLFLKCKV